MKCFYIVTAYRFGDRELHSYIVGVYSTYELAFQYADIEENFRGGKYTCEVLAVKVDYVYPSDEMITVLKALPVPTLEQLKSKNIRNYHNDDREFTREKNYTCGVF